MEIEAERDTDALFSLLIPLERMRLIVPRDCVAEVVGWDAGRSAGEAVGRPWQVGEVPWNGRTIPVVSYERLCGLRTDLPQHRARVVVMRCLGDWFEAGCFGILTRGFPQLVRVSPQALVPSARSSWPEEAPVLCELAMVGQSPVIPDLERVERQLAGAGR